MSSRIQNNIFHFISGHGGSSSSSGNIKKYNFKIYIYFKLYKYFIKKMINWHSYRRSKDSCKKRTTSFHYTRKSMNKIQNPVTWCSFSFLTTQLYFTWKCKMKIKWNKILLINLFFVLFYLYLCSYINVVHCRFIVLIVKERNRY